MNFIKKHKRKIISVFCIVIMLIIAFFYGGSNTNNTNNTVTDKSSLVHNTTTEPTPAVETTETTITAEAPQETIVADIKETTKYSEKNDINIDTKTEADQHNTEPEANETEETEIINTDLTCTLSVKCENAVGKSSEKAFVIPENGIIFAEQEVVFYEGESVFNLLVREMKKNKIHLEFVNTPIYNSAYIEGIGNLYEFDCGELSGWMYKVNNWFPNYSCSLYELKQGDKIEWVYTCDLGKDVGGEYSAKNGMINE